MARLGTLALCATALCATPAAADVAVVVDRATLNDVLGEVTLDRVQVPIGGERHVTVGIEDLEVIGLDPAGGKNGEGFILSSLRLRVPDFGVNIKVKPRISLHVVQRETDSLLELRFEKVPLSLPLAGTINVARFLPPLRYPTDSVWYLAGARGDVPIASKLKRVEMGSQAIRFVFEVAVQQPIGR